MFKIARKLSFYQVLFLLAISGNTAILPMAGDPFESVKKMDCTSFIAFATTVPYTKIRLITFNLAPEIKIKLITSLLPIALNEPAKIPLLLALLATTHKNVWELPMLIPEQAERSLGKNIKACIKAHKTLDNLWWELSLGNADLIESIKKYRLRNQLKTIINNIPPLKFTETIAHHCNKKKILSLLIQMTKEEPAKIPLLANVITNFNFQLPLSTSNKTRNDLNLFFENNKTKTFDSSYQMTRQLKNNKKEIKKAGSLNQK